MLARISLLLCFAVLSGCAWLGQTPESDDLGQATRCVWIGNVPTLCVYDHTRYTIDKDALYELLDKLHDYKQKERNRRAL